MDCFLAPADPEMDGKRPCGYSSVDYSASQCTANKQFSLEDTFRPVKFPLSDKIMLKTACCCCNCGFNFDEGWVGMGKQSELCCYSGAGNCLVLCSEDPKYGRACQGFSCLYKNCSCESGQPVIPMLQTSACLFCCVFQADNSAKVECCPKPMSIWYEREHFCCCWRKTSCPFCGSEDVPCEIGCCGIMCMAKPDATKDFEQKYPELFLGTATVEPAPAVVAVPVGEPVGAKEAGAPSTMIDDAGLDGVVNSQPAAQVMCRGPFFSHTDMKLLKHRE